MWPRLLVALPLLLAFAPAVHAGERRPNLIFILVDDLRYDGLGCTGHPFVKTPNIDRIAREGMRFKNAFVTTPLCSPARASFLTGRYVHAHGVKGNGDNSARSHQLATFLRLLRARGYATGYIGKWHMGTDDTPRPGIDHWVSFKGQGPYRNPMLNINGKREEVEGYTTDLLNRHAVEFVRKKHGKPFVLYLAHKAVHGPFTPAERHKELYVKEPWTAPVKGTLAGKPAITENKGKEKPKMKKAAPAGAEAIMRNQMRCLMSIDDGVGALFKALEETGQLDNTIIVFTSDNGYFWGEHGLGDKRWAYEESIRIPLLIRAPGRTRAGTTSEALVLNIDFAPTFLELGGAAIPKEVQGRSLVPLLRGETKGWRTSFLAEYFQEPNFPRVPTWQAVRTDRWIYIHYPANKNWDELYDLRADARQVRNLIRAATAQQTLQELRTELERLRKSTGG